MEDEKAIKKAQDVLSTVCAMLDEHDWKYEAHPDKLYIYCSAQGDDLPIELNIKVNPGLEIVSVLSPMPFIVPENRRKELAVAVSCANYGIVDGNFDYSYPDGKILFKLTASYAGSIISKDLLEYMLFVSCGTIDKYNDKFLAVSKNTMNYGEIIKFMK